MFTLVKVYVESCSKGKVVIFDGKDEFCFMGLVDDHVTLEFSASAAKYY